MRIRNYRQGDYDKVNALWKATGLGGAKRSDTESVILHTLTKGGKFLIMEEAGSETLVGTSWITNDGRRLHLHHFGIKPDYQRKGYAKLLLQHSLDFVKQMNMQVKLEVEQSNTPAIALYNSYGFSRLGDYDIYIIRDVSLLE